MKVLYSPLQFCSCHENVSFVCLTLMFILDLKIGTKLFLWKSTFKLMQHYAHQTSLLSPSLLLNTNSKTKQHNKVLIQWLYVTFFPEENNSSIITQPESLDECRGEGYTKNQNDCLSWKHTVQPRHSVTESWHHGRQSRDIRSDLTSTPTPEICGRWSRTSQAEDAKSPLSSLLHLQRTGQRHSPQRMLEERCWEWICIPVCALKTTNQPARADVRQTATIVPVLKQPYLI